MNEEQNTKKMGMKIEFKGNKISSLSEWENLVFVGSKKKDWKEGRSAYSLADYTINKNGVEEIQALISNIVNEDVTLKKGCPEFEVRFDHYGHGREHDLAVWGETKSGKSLFLGIEAKVDESFGYTIEKVWNDAEEKIARKEKTNAKKRIEDLLEFNFGEKSKEDYQLRYQLLFSTAGTLRVKADIHIMLILVFKTDLYDEIKGTKNHDDFKKFIKRANAEDLGQNAFKLTLDKKELIMIYREISTTDC